MSSSTRIRSRGDYTPGPFVYNMARYRNCSDLNWVTLGSTSSCKVGLREETEDTVVGNFAQRRAKGEIFFNPYRNSKIASYVDQVGDGPSFRAVSNSCSSPVLKQEGELNGAWLALLLADATLGGIIRLGSAVVSVSDDKDLATEVSTRCLSERGKASNNLFESVAEYKQALRLMQLPIRKLQDLARGIPSVKFGPGEGAAAWATYRWGIMPLVRDISGIISGLQKKVGPKRQTVRASGEISKYASTTLSFPNAWGAGVYNQTVIQETLDTISYRAMSLDDYVASLASNVGFTTKGLLTVPWELIPWSFVADWFANIGDFIGALSPSPGFHQLGSCLVRRREVNTSFVPGVTTPTNAAVNTVTRQCTGACRSFTVVKTRGPLSKPGLVVKSDFRFDKFLRQADALALITIQLNKIFRR